MTTNRTTTLLPLGFVLLWSTGFIGARLGLPHAPPLTFLLLRYLAVVLLMTLLALATGAPWPRTGRQWLHLGIAGLLIHGVYLGGVFIAISRGLPAGVTSLVVGLQPLLTAVTAGLLLKERVSRNQWLGLMLGFVGVAMVVAGKIGTGFGLPALLAALAALLGITLGLIYQKSFCASFDWRSGAVAQFIPTALLTGLLAWATEDMRVDWQGEFIFALGWLTLVLSLGAISLLNWLVRRGSAVNTASWFYLVPPFTAVFAWLLFGETLSGQALLGMGLAVLGVYLARPPAKA
ncbi:DMT family transporter [Paucibacter sp. KCTC 42545]|uniref:DMT family transporter n=1 Tax=Paucibacter sp. KCTC 42545 TaxID=1768242 RepID=UPI000733BCA0|nr:DMT family transporter [Paucibacter sp. KCTC 42545]ALT77595.1 peptide ABC transporter ATP-binding protein [Paucibacter sp. KCTC 42545]